MVEEKSTTPERRITVGTVAVGEATPIYMYWSACPDRIHAYNPGMIEHHSRYRCAEIDQFNQCAILFGVLRFVTQGDCVPDAGWQVPLLRNYCPGLNFIGPELLLLNRHQIGILVFILVFS